MRISLNQQLEELDRELQQRGQVYPRLIAQGKLRQSIADYQLARLCAIRESIKWLADHEAMIKQRMSY